MVSSSKGATLLWAIGALVVIGGLGAAVAVMSPSTIQSKLEQEAAMRAYYNANAGLNFIYSMEHASEAANVPFSNFITNMGNGNVVTYPLSNGGQFSFQLNSVNMNGNNGNYTISNLVGSVNGASGGRRYSYVVYGGGKGESGSKSYSYSSPVNGMSTKGLGGKINISFGGDVNADLYGTTITMNDGSNLTGSITSTSATDTLVVTKNVLGTISKPIVICSNSSITVATSGNILYGDVNAQGDVIIGRPMVGNVRAGGKVTFNSNASVTGDVYAAGTIDTSNGHIYGTAHVNSRASITGSGSVDNISVEIVSNPAKCDQDVWFPLHETPTTTIDFDASTSPLCPARKCTFSGKDLNDHSYSFRNFKIDWGYSVCFDLSSGYVNIFASGDTIVTPQNVYIKTSSSASCFTNQTKLPASLGLSYKDYASKLYMDVTGKFTLSGGVWFGTVYAGSDVLLNSGSYITGALYSSGGSITGISGPQPDLHLDYVQSEYFSKR